MSNLERWPTETEAAAALGTSTKTLSRYASQGKLEVRKRPRPGKKPENVCNPRDVENLKPVAYVVGQTKPLNGASLEKTHPEELLPLQLVPVTRELIETISTAVKTIGTNWNGPKLLNPPLPDVSSHSVALDKKLCLTLDEARAYSGLARTALRRAVISGDLAVRRDGPRGALLIRRTDLEAYLA